jgi:translation initiation factor 3 subunit J
MADNWDDSDDDDWDMDDDALDAKLGLNKKSDEPANNFDDEEDLALKEKLAREKLEKISLKKKGSALAAKKQAEKDQADDLEIARKALELEAEMEANMTVEERRELQRKREEDADADVDDAFGGGISSGGVGSRGQAAGDKVLLKDTKDHMKHARKVADAMKAHGKIHLASIFIKELISQSKDVLDDAAITDIIKSCNVIKNEKVQQAKRKTKGQAQKSKKQDKIEKAKAKKVQDDLFGDSNQYDEYDAYGEAYEEDYF